MQNKKYDQREEDVRWKLTENIKIRLERKSITQKIMAREIGFSESSLSAGLNGERNFKPGELKCIADYLEITMDELFTGVALENQISHERTGLKTFAIDWLAKIREEDGYLVEMVDVVLNNESIANALFEMLYLYATHYLSSVKYEKSGVTVPVLAHALSSNDVLLKFAISDFTSQIFEAVREIYDRLDESHHKKATEENIYRNLMKIRENLEKQRVFISKIDEDEYNEFISDMEEERQEYYSRYFESSSENE